MFCERIGKAYIITKKMVKCFGANSSYDHQTVNEVSIMQFFGIACLPFEVGFGYQSAHLALFKLCAKFGPFMVYVINIWQDFKNQLLFIQYEDE